MSGSIDTVAAVAAEQRSIGRTNLYLSAMLHWPGGQCAVRIRNLSPHGAMVEAGVLPPIGAPVELRRGRLRAQGSAAWSHAGRGGLRLEDVIAVKDWMAPAANSGQQRVDGLVAALRSGDRPTDWPSSPDPVVVRPRDDLRTAVRLLDRLGDALASDPEVVMAHGSKLQLLDVVQQLLTALMDDGGGGGARLADLRRAAAAALEG